MKQAEKIHERIRRHQDNVDTYNYQGASESDVQIIQNTLQIITERCELQGVFKHSLQDRAHVIEYLFSLYRVPPDCTIYNDTGLFFMAIADLFLDTSDPQSRQKLMDVFKLLLLKYDTRTEKLSTTSAYIHETSLLEIPDNDHPLLHKLHEWVEMMQRYNPQPSMVPDKINTKSFQQDESIDTTVRDKSYDERITEAMNTHTNEEVSARLTQQINEQPLNSPIASVVKKLSLQHIRPVTIKILDITTIDFTKIFYGAAYYCDDLICLPSDFDNKSLMHEFAHTQSAANGNGLRFAHDSVLFTGLTEAITELSHDFPVTYVEQRMVVEAMTYNNPHLQKALFEAYTKQELYTDFLSLLLKTFGPDGLLALSQMGPYDDSANPLLRAIAVSPEYVLQMIRTKKEVGFGHLDSSWWEKDEVDPTIIKIQKNRVMTNGVISPVLLDSIIYDRHHRGYYFNKERSEKSDFFIFQKKEIT